VITKSEKETKRREAETVRKTLGKKKGRKAKK
jgi:hypothetical protein